MSGDVLDHDLTAIGLLDEPVRRRLYEWVVSRGEPVGREAAARAVGITRSLASFHLDRLVAGGLLEAGYRRLSGRSGPGAGRPAKVYSRAGREISISLPERRYERAAELFASALEALGGDGPPGQLREEARRMGEELVSGSPSSDDPATRLTQALTANGYEPFVTDDGAIRLRNCPFHALVEEHRPLVCGTNLELARGIVHGAGTQAYEPVLDAQLGSCCVAFVPVEQQPGQ